MVSEKYPGELTVLARGARNKPVMRDIPESYLEVV